MARALFLFGMKWKDSFFFIRFSVLTDTLPPLSGYVILQTWKAQQEAWRVNTPPYGVWLKEHAKLSPAACRPQSPWQSTSSYQEVNWRRVGNELWEEHNCLNDGRWHLTDEFNVIIVLPGKFSWMCDSESQVKLLTPKCLRSSFLSPIRY